MRQVNLIVEVIISLWLLLMASSILSQAQPVAYDLLQKGLDLYDQCEYNESIQACDKAIELNPNYAEALNCKGIALFKNSMYNESLDAFNRAIQIDPQLYGVWNNKGAALSRQFRFDDAYLQLIKLLNLIRIHTKHGIIKASFFVTRINMMKP